MTGQDKAYNEEMEAYNALPKFWGLTGKGWRNLGILVGSLGTLASVLYGTLHVGLLRNFELPVLQKPQEERKELTDYELSCTLTSQRMEQGELGYMMYTLYACPDGTGIVTGQQVLGPDGQGWIDLAPPIIYTVFDERYQSTYSDVEQDGWNGNETLEERIEYNE